MTEKQKDLTTFVVKYGDLKKEKEKILMLLVHGTIDLLTYNDMVALIERIMNAQQFRYINKYRIIDRTLVKKEFNLAPEDLTKFNYN